jgi:7-carboxy-7-deazaguanine synthase
MGRVPPDVTGQLRLVDDPADDGDEDDDAPPAVAAAPVPGAPEAGKSGGRATKARRAKSTGRRQTRRSEDADESDARSAPEDDDPTGDTAGGDDVDLVAADAKRSEDEATPSEPVEVALATEMVVSEVFGPTFQGEGPSLGRRAGFVRLGRCSLDCSWCDTPYTWDWTRYDATVELRNLSVVEVVERLEAMEPEIVVITGGEPLLQQRRLLPLLQVCAERGWPVEIETNGTLSPDEALVPLVARWNVSPKLANSGVAAKRAIRPQTLAAFQATGRAVFKFVVAEPDDLDEIAELVRLHDVGPIWIMPEGTDPSTVLSRSRRLADPVLARGWNMTTRLHTLLWGDQRGR